MGAPSNAPSRDRTRAPPIASTMMQPAFHAPPLHAWGGATQTRASQTCGMRRTTRRGAMRAAALAVVAAALPSGSQRVVAAEAADGFLEYRGPLALGFSFGYPVGWAVKKKPIKTHVSEVIVSSDTEPGTSAGLVVDAVTIGSIESFGSPESVGKKVVNVETKKDSVNSATVVNSSAVKDADGLTYYIIDYVVDSSRGIKRYLAKATITGGQLFVFTAQAKNDEFEGETSDTLTRMLASFKVAKQYQ